MQTIWKFELVATDEQKVSMPVGAKILTVQLQKDTLVLWAMVPYTDAREDRTICVFGTGNPIPGSNSNYRYIGTFQQDWFVGHVFEKI